MLALPWVEFGGSVSLISDAILEPLAFKDRYSTSEPEDRHLTIKLPCHAQVEFALHVPSGSHALPLSDEFVRHAAWWYTYYIAIKYAM